MNAHTLTQPMQAQGHPNMAIQAAYLCLRVFSQLPCSPWPVFSSLTSLK